MSKFIGKTDGEFKVFNDGGVAKCYKWDHPKRKWELFGDVTMSPAETQPQTRYYEGDRLFEAGDYDHIFDIESGDGIIRKLPFNNGGNSDEAANKFCVREGFSKSNLEQIVTHIRNNSLPYQTRDLSANKKPEIEIPKLKNIPMQTNLFYEQVNVDAPEKKIREFNEELKSIEEKENMNFNRLLKVIRETHLYHSSELLKAEWDVFKKLLKWPKKYIFPVLDLFRMFLLHSQASEMFKVFEHG
jgi:phospholipase A-2-activating protein